MPSRDPIEAFLAAGIAERMRMATDLASAFDVEAYLGAKAFADYRRLAAGLDVRHLGVGSPTNLIFLPGIMGSQLNSRTCGGVWWLDVRNLDKIDRLRLAPDGASDADPNDAVVPFTTDPTYDPFLVAVLAEDRLGHDLFAYDWRKLLAASTAALKKKIEEIHAGNGGREVHLVAHSMGGLLVQATLAAHGNDALWSKLGKIVFIGTPHYGAPVIASYLKKHLWGFELLALLGSYLSRETFRSLWGVLSLLPAPAGVYPGTRPNDPQPWTGGSSRAAYVHPAADFDLYDAAAWGLGLDAPATARLQTILDAVADFHRRLFAAHRALAPDRRDRMRMVAGVGYKTVFRLERAGGWTGIFRDVDVITSRERCNRHREGDGQVPLASAEIEGVKTHYIRGEHGGLTNVPAVYRDVLRWLRDGTEMSLPTTCHEAISGHLAASELRSAAPHLDGSARAARQGDDPGYLDPQPPSSTRLAELRQEADGGRLDDLRAVKIL